MMRLPEVTLPTEVAERLGRYQQEVDDLRDSPNLTVWHEMKRQRDSFPELRCLFDEIPEAMAW